MTTLLKWRLGKLPTSDEVLRLIDNKIITKEEGRDILFNQETEEDVNKKDLQEEIKFLREVVQKLSSNKTKIIEVIKEVQKPYYQWGWYGPYATWCGTTSGGSVGVGGTTTAYYATALGSNNLSGLASASSTGVTSSTGATSQFSLGGGSLISGETDINFSDIKTF